MLDSLIKKHPKLSAFLFLMLLSLPALLHALFSLLIQYV